MVDVISVNDFLADQVEKELYAPLKPKWNYYPTTTDFYEVAANEEEKGAIDKLSKEYGPVIDTQRFTYIVYNTSKENPSFWPIRNNPQSYFRKTFTYFPVLLDHIQELYIPKNYRIDRCLVNMQTIRPSWSMNAIHPDVRNQEAITVLYYVNNSDGDTYFFDHNTCIKQVPPIKGTAAVYPAATFHAGSTPTKNETRTVINIVFNKVK